jgi:hypothetical protein
MNTYFGNIIVEGNNVQAAIKAVRDLSIPGLQFAPEGVVTFDPKNPQSNYEGKFPVYLLEFCIEAPSLPRAAKEIGIRISKAAMSAANERVSIQIFGDRWGKKAKIENGVVKMIYL